MVKASSNDEAHTKIKRESKVRFLTKNTYYDEVFSVSKRIIKLWSRSLNLVSVPGLYSDIDIQSGKYEGGFKVWECAGDLIKFISEDRLIDHILHRRNTHSFKALELGAGAALPSITLLSRIIGDEDYELSYRIHVQDYNWQVLASVTLMNFAINFPLDYFEALLRTKSLRFYHGHWKNWQGHHKYDLIMMSEVIYNADSFDSLHNLLANGLKKTGYAVMATKNTYFGLSGGLEPWLSFIKSRDLFRVVDLLPVTTFNVPRSILIISLK